MHNENGKSNETDITGILVVSLFVMLGILFVTMSNKFTQTKTSTSTRAAVPNDADAGCGGQPLNLTGSFVSDQYNAFNDKCAPACNSYYNYSDPTTQCNWGYIQGLTCCRSKYEVPKIGDARCKRLNPGKNAKCKQSCGTGESLASGDCAYTSTSVIGSDGYLNKGVCCEDLNAPLASTPIPNTPTPVPSSARDCGKFHIDCQTTFNDTSILCMGNATQAWCGYKLTGTVAASTKCPGTKAAYPILDKSGNRVAGRSLYCLKAAAETPYNTGSSSYYCAFTQVLVKGMNDSGLTSTDKDRLEQCKKIVAQPGHTQD